MLSIAQSCIPIVSLYPAIKLEGPPGHFISLRYLPNKQTCLFQPLSKYASEVFQNTSKP